MAVREKKKKDDSHLQCRCRNSVSSVYGKPRPFKVRLTSAFSHTTCMNCWYIGLSSWEAHYLYKCVTDSFSVVGVDISQCCFV